MLFCLTLHQFCQCVSYALSIPYLDDVTIGGPLAATPQDLAVVREVEDIGLILNSSIVGANTMFMQHNSTTSLLHASPYRDERVL